MRRLLTSLAMGVLGCALALFVWHLWLDHRTFHALLDAVLQAQKAAPH